jgi:hypothetical protein
MTKNLVTRLENMKSDLTGTISSFSQEQLNIIPFHGSWTAGQVTEHILLSVAGVTKALYGKTKETEREPGKKVELIRSLFLDFSQKLNAPGFIIPSPATYQPEALLQSAIETMDASIRAVHTLDLTSTCLEFELPRFGKFTRLEWANFIVYHSLRHIHQMKNILRKIMLGRLNMIEGRWKTTGTVTGTPVRPEKKISGYDTYEWMPGEFFMKHTVDVLMGNSRTEGIEIIGYDVNSKQFSLQSYDNSGNMDVMSGQITNGEWSVSNETLRFNGKFSTDGRQLTGTWELSHDGINWQHFMDVQLEKETAELVY